MQIIHEDLLAMVEEMPAFPQGVSKVLDLCSKVDCSPKDLVSVVERDPVLAMRVLKLVNSPFIGLSQPISSISHGVAYVGMNTIKNIALTVAAIGMLPRENKANFDMDKFLQHSLGTAAVCKRMAGLKGVKETNSADYFLAGLLHDFGKVILVRQKPDQFSEALEEAQKKKLALDVAERMIYKIDHAEIGAVLAAHWALPEGLVRAIRYHHSAGDLSNPSLLEQIVMAGNLVVHRLGFGSSGNYYPAELPKSIMENLGMNIDEIISAIGDTDSLFADAKAFAST
tara:strand:+ start:238 stop:1089 length:852 start_codon:yes stop_codon:yes gene_type:complete